MVEPSTVNGTELGAQEWRDTLFLKYGLETPDLPHYYEGCNATFSIYHTPDYKWGGLVTVRHIYLCDRVADLSRKAFTPTHVHDEPLIFAGYAVKSPKENLARSKSTNTTAASPPLEAMEQKSDLLIRDLWNNGTDSVHKMRVVNTYAKSHFTKTPETCL